MADNTTITPGSGATIRTDDVGGVQYQVVKLDGGGDGLSVPIVAGRNADASSLPVALSTEDVALVGATGETAPASDTASSGLNGRLQRIAQRITSLIALVPAALVGGRFDINVGGFGGTAVVNGGLAGSQSVGGTVANNVAPTGNPVPLAGIAVSSEPTANTATRVSQLLTDLVGKLIVLPYANPENNLIGTITTSMTGTTSTAVSGMGAQGAGIRNYVTSIIISNAHATVGTDVILQDGSGGTTLGTFPAAAVYGGVAITLPNPLKTTANTGLFAANVTTGASTKVTCYGFKGV